MSFTLRPLSPAKEAPVPIGIDSSWLRIRRPVFDSQALPEKKVVGLERGLLSLVSTADELLDRKVAAPV
jgi:hypothetical protein